MNSVKYNSLGGHEREIDRDSALKNGAVFLHTAESALEDIDWRDDSHELIRNQVLDAQAQAAIAQGYIALAEALKD